MSLDTVVVQRMITQTQETITQMDNIMRRNEELIDEVNNMKDEKPQDKTVMILKLMSQSAKALRLKWECQWFLDEIKTDAFISICR